MSDPDGHNDVNVVHYGLYFLIQALDGLDADVNIATPLFAFCDAGSRWAQCCCGTLLLPFVMLDVDGHKAEVKLVRY